MTSSVLKMMSLLTVTVIVFTSPNTLWVIWPALGMGIALLSEVLGISSSKKVS